ncbi:hypothetical protein [Pseudomonas anguilliseptica]|nr:hypothetical protein [Pseudomonas anguilliseptica]
MPSKAPVRLGSATHGIPDGWPVRIESVSSPAELNTPEGESIAAKRVDADTIELNSENGSTWRSLSAGGVLVFNTPVELAGWQARAAVRDRVGGTLQFTWDSNALNTPDALITVDLAAHAFVLHMSADQAAALTWSKGVWELEAIDPTGRVYQVIGVSKVMVSSEVVI